MQVDGFTNRIGVAGLAAVAFISVLGGTVIAAAGHEIPQGFYTIGGAAIGALSGFMFQRITTTVTQPQDESPLKMTTKIEP